MTDAGYTLTETLAAMAVIGLAAGGLSLGMSVLGGQQAGAAAVVRRSQDARAAEAWLERRLAEHGPYRAHEADRLSGEAGEFTFPCEGPAQCAARLEAEGAEAWLVLTPGAGRPARFRLPSAEAARLLYVGGRDASTHWPPASGARQALRAVTVLQGEPGAEQPVLTAQVRAEQPLACAFDPILQDCR